MTKLTIRFALRLLALVAKTYPRERGKFKLLQTLFLPIAKFDAEFKAVRLISFNVRMLLQPSEFLQAHLFLFGSYELPTVRFIRRTLQNGGVMFDVGAQMGYLSLVASTAHNGVQVHAFEPEPRNIERLQTNLQLNPSSNIVVHPLAASNTDGIIRLYLSRDNNAGTHSTVADLSTVNASDFVDLPCTKLDTFYESNGQPAVRLIKIDVEGGELEVIQGSRELLKAQRPFLIIEMSDVLQQTRGYSTQQFKQLLAEMDYASFTLSDDGYICASGLDVGHAMENVVFVHSSRMNEVQSLLAHKDA